MSLAFKEFRGVTTSLSAGIEPTLDNTWRVGDFGIFVNVADSLVYLVVKSRDTAALADADKFNIIKVQNNALNATSVNSININAYLNTFLAATNLTQARAALSLAFGTAAGTYCEGNDARLTNSRTPTAHKVSHAIGGSDPLTPADIGAASLAQGTLATTAIQPGANISVLTNNLGYQTAANVTASILAHSNQTTVAHGISAFGATLVDDANAAEARTTLELGTIALQNVSNVSISGGAINNTTVGATVRSTGAFTTLVATTLDGTPIGSITPSTGAFTTISASGLITGAIPKPVFTDVASVIAFLDSVFA